MPEIIDLLPRRARFSERARTAPKIVPPPPPPRTVLETLLAPPPSPARYPAIVTPAPGDLVQLIQGGVGRVPSVFTDYQSIAPPPSNETFVYIRSPTTSYSLPAAATLNQKVTVSDASGTATAAPILVAAADGALITGSPTFSLNQNWSSASFVWNGSQWSIV